MIIEGYLNYLDDIEIDSLVHDLDKEFTRNIFKVYDLEYLYDSLEKGDLKALNDLYKLYDLEDFGIDFSILIKLCEKQSFFI